MTNYNAPINEYGWTPLYSICEETGLRVCEYYECLLVREDGMVKNVNPNPKAKMSNKQWHCGCTDCGYKKVLIPTTTQTRKHIHRLVGLSFIPLIEGKDCINHIDGVKTNNTVTNLEWCTKAENNNHATVTGLMSSGTKHYNAKKIGRFSLDDNLLETYHGGKSLIISQGFLSSDVYQCCKGNIKTHKGFKWKYLD